MTSFQSDIITFTVADLKRLFLRHRSKIQRAAIAGGIAAFVFLIFQEPTYRQEATFKQSSKQTDLSFNMKEMFQQYMAMPSENAVVAVMQSKGVLRGVAEELGMQAECNTEIWIVKGVRRIWENLCSEFGGSLSDRDSFGFSNVAYSGEKPLKLFVKLTNEGRYQLFDAKKRMLGSGALGEQIAISNAKLTLNRIPKDAKAERFYSLLIKPWEGVVEGLRKRLAIAPLKQDKNILKIEFNHRDRVLGTDFVNRLMLGYQNYLKRENSEICQEQYKYIQKREEELTKNFDLSLAEHVAYLKENLSKSGFIGFAQEVEILSEPKTLYTSKLFDVDLELNRLNNHKDSTYLAKRDKDQDAEKEKKERKHKEDKTRVSSIGVAESRQLMNNLESCSLDQQRYEAAICEPDNQELIQVSEQIKEAVVLLESVEKRAQIPAMPSLLKEPKSAIALLVKQIADSREISNESQTVQNAPPINNHVPYIREFISQLEQKKLILEEDYKLRKNGMDEFSGLSLATAQGLLVEYTRQRDSLQAQMRELVFLRDQIGRSDFEMSSLGGVIDDGVTRDIVNKASTIALQLKDENNRSLREQERLVETLQTQKSFLSHYLLQTCDLKRLRVKLLGDKIASLQQQTLSLLETEKRLLKNKLEELNVKMSDLPEKWRRESLLLLKKELGAAMIEGISQLGETKSLSQHMFQVSSRPLDRAFPPVRPQSQKMMLISFISAALAGICCYFLIFCRSLFKGLPVSDENLKMSGFPVSGKLSQYCNTHLAEMRNEDLETLRRIAEFLSIREKGMEAITAVCIGGKYPDYSLSLAELLAMRGLRTLVMQCVFDKVVRPDEIPGLWQYMHGQETDLPLRRHLTYDFLPSGGTSRHGAEIMSSSKFHNLLASLKKKYDVVLIYSSADAATAEGFSMLKIADCAIVTVQQENKEELVVYHDWAQQKGANSATFVYADEFS